MASSTNIAGGDGHALLLQTRYIWRSPQAQCYCGRPQTHDRSLGEGKWTTIIDNAIILLPRFPGFQIICGLHVTCSPDM